MFFASFITLAVAAGSAMAIPTKQQAPSSALVASITSNSESIHSIDDLVLTAKVENTGSEDLTVVKYATVLDDTLPTRSFKVKNGEKDVAFTGVQLQVDLDAAGDDAFVTIPAHSSVSVNHTLASVYDFTEAGTGSFDFAPLVNFYTLTPVQAVKGAKINAVVSAVDRLSSVDTEAHSISVEITGDVAKRELIPKRSTVQCQDSGRANFMKASYSESKKLASMSADFIRSNNGGELFNKYFSSNSQGSVAGVFDSVASESDSGRGMYCSDPHNVCGGQRGIIAYTWLATTEVYYCDMFFTEVPQSELCVGGTTVDSRNVRGATTLHEFTHALSGTDDINYGCPRNTQLNPGQQMDNADNFNCFATAVFAQLC